MQSPALLAVAYRANGRKLTPQRQLIFQLMHENETHPTAEDLFAQASAQMPGISLRTVYQTLNELAEMGELQINEIGSGAIRFDPNTAHHHHAVCDSCGQIRDVYVQGAASLRPIDSFNFVINEVGVIFRGNCSACETGRRKGSSPRGTKSPVRQAKVSKK